MPETRITIKYCTQCKWMLRAAYFAQELLSTFGTDLDEVALRPVTGGVFTITFYGPGVSQSHSQSQSQDQSQNQGQDQNQEGKVIWDRKTDGGFPEVKFLKARVRDILDPQRDLGHTDRAIRQGHQGQGQGQAQTQTQTGTEAKAKSEVQPKDGVKGEECHECQ